MFQQKFYTPTCALFVIVTWRIWYPKLLDATFRAKSAISGRHRQPDKSWSIKLMWIIMIPSQGSYKTQRWYDFPISTLKDQNRLFQCTQNKSVALFVSNWIPILRWFFRLALKNLIYQGTSLALIFAVNGTAALKIKSLLKKYILTWEFISNQIDFYLGQHS